MKAILEFTLPEESDEFNTARKAGSFHCILIDMDNYLRAKLKYEELDEKTADIYQEIRDKLTELVHARDITLY